MPYQANTGWRNPSPAAGALYPKPEEQGKEDLFRLARMAGEAFCLRASSRHVLEYLVGCYRGELIKDLLLVWPSNEFLMRQTGLSERAVRYALKELIHTGVIAARDSANGKRFAVRSRAGQIIDAYGFDLSPLLARRQELEAVCDRLREERQIRKAQFDEITICRRQIQAFVQALGEDKAEMVSTELDRLQKITPRRDSRLSAAAVIAMWRSLKEEAERLYNTAFGGNECRHIEDNQDSPDQSCSNGLGMNVGSAVADVLDACPDALAYASDTCASLDDLAREAGRLRGGLGVHQSAWEEAVEGLGAAAGIAFFVTLQHYDLDQARKCQIRNFGGYFRAFVRKIVAGQLDLKQEIAALKYRRRN